MPHDAFLNAYFYVIALILGLCMGSFCNCLAWRVTHGESVMHGRSHCATCGHVLAARDLVPVVSWILSRGRCRYCNERVSVRYPVTELVCAAAYVSLLACYGLTLQTVELALFASVLLVLSLTDLDEFVIPNATIVAALIVRLAYIAVGGVLGLHDPVQTLAWSLVNGFVVALPVLLLTLAMDRVLGRASMGMGDIKLLFVAGAYFGWQQCLFLIIVACILGLVLGVVLGSMHGRVGQQTKENDSEDDVGMGSFPFGPAIALSCWICMLVGPWVTSWYFGLFA